MHLQSSFSLDLNNRSSHQRSSIKKVFLKIVENSQDNKNFIKKETPVQVFMKIFSTEDLRTTAFRTRIRPQGIFYRNLT